MGDSITPGTQLSSGGASSAQGPQAGASAETAGGIPLEQFRSEFIRASCEHLFTCLWGEETLMARLGLGTRDACVEMFDFFHGPDVQVRVDAVSRGLLSYDAAEARRCIDGLPDACMMFAADDVLAAFHGVCAGVFDGGQPLGGDCTSDEDCSGAAFCDVDVLAEPLCQGYCRLQARPGDPCELYRQCSPEGGFDAYCVTTTSQCQLHRQAGPVGEGEACGWIPAESGTVDVVRCEVGLWCDTAYLETGVCRQPIAAGAPCESQAQPCVDGYACLEGTCRQWTIQTAVGAPVPCSRVRGVRSGRWTRLRSERGL